jgi:REP element-mobilizing transposase RayT
MSFTDTGDRGRLARRGTPSHHLDMPRVPRVDAPGAMHHVIPKGSAGEAIFRDDHDRKMLVKRLGEAVRRYDWSCLAYCLLDTHFHAVVSTKHANLGRGMQWLLAPYSREFNVRHERAGNLFHTRFYSKLIESDAHLTATLVYVHLNPVRAGAVTRPELWPWCSYAATVGHDDMPAFLDGNAVLELFDTRREVARMMLELAVRDALEAEFGSAGIRTRG